MKRLIFLILPLILSSLTIGCAANMAAKQPDKKDLTVLNRGTPREHVIAELGAPTWTGKRDSRTIDIFSFVQGYSKTSKTGRVVAHGLLDVVSLGLWEVVGTPIESYADGTEIKVVVRYGDDEAVRDVEILSGKSSVEGVLASDSYDPLIDGTGLPEDNEVGGRSDLVRTQFWSVIIGISDYKDTHIPSLRYASKDASSFYDWVVSPTGGKLPPSRVQLLLDKEATQENIRNALFVWLKQALEEDVVLIYFAGHGSPDSPDSQNLFLLPHDTKYDNIATTGFPMWDIETALKRFVKAKKVIVMADACHSGGIGQEYDIARRSSRGIKVNPINSGIHNLSNIGDGICVISASSDDQYSQESEKWGGGHGVFTHFLLEGLRGTADFNKDSSISLGELTSFLSERVRRETGGNQSPIVSGRYDPALAIGR
jgi:hypothetical protein